jgi:hypothetical protein
MSQLNFFIQNIQGVLFIENFAFRDKLRIASKINETVNNLFDGDPTMLDLPVDAPPEIPRIQLKDSKSHYSLNFCLNRIDLFYNEAGKPEKKLATLKEDYLNYFFKIVALVKDDYHLSTPRIALVLKSVSDVERGANLFMAEKFLGNMPFFKDTYALEIHTLEKKELKEFEINRWFRIKTARSQLTKSEVLFVEIDINTQGEKPKEYKKEEIRQFCLTAIEFAEDNFRNCFGVPL